MPNLLRRQGGYGRGGRQKIETDHVEVLSGVWRGVTLGSPIALLIPNKDFKINQMEDLDRPRPGHGDLSGSIKYLTSVRAILERASARETTARVAAGALAKQLLEPLGITAFAYVVQVGERRFRPSRARSQNNASGATAASCTRSIPIATTQVAELIDNCKKAGDTLGGIVEIRVEGLPYGLGTHTQWDKKLDGRLAQAVMAVQAMKGVEIGMGFEAAADARLAGPRPDPVRSQPDPYAVARFHAGTQQCRRVGGRHDQFAAAGAARGDETDQHFGQAAGVGQLADEAIGVGLL